MPDAINLTEMYPYRPDEAKRLLKELGYDKKNPLRFAILVGNQDATLADMALEEQRRRQDDVDDEAEDEPPVGPDGREERSPVEGAQIGRAHV